MESWCVFLKAHLCIANRAGFLHKHGPSLKKKVNWMHILKIQKHGVANDQKYKQKLYIS